MSLSCATEELQDFFCNHIYEETGEGYDDKKVMTMPLHQTGLDSLGLIEMFLEAEDRFSINIDIDNIHQDATLGDVLNDIYRIYGQPSE